MKYLLTYVVIMLCSIPSDLSSKILPCPSIQYFYEEVSKSDDKAIVFIDVDDTTIVACDMILRPAGRPYVKNFLQSIASGNISSSLSIKEIRSLVMESMKVEPVEPCTIEYISKLQGQQKTVIALTAARTSELAPISARDWRFEQLKNIGIDFRKSSNFQGSYELRVEPYEKNRPWYDRGIIFTDDAPKGPVTVAFLKKNEIHPSCVIVLDDKLSYLESLEDSLSEQGIPFIGYHYTYLDNLREIPLEAIYNYQFIKLINDHIWVSDMEARHILRIPD